jgi:hypothetical protein
MTIAGVAGVASLTTLPTLGRAVAFSLGMAVVVTLVSVGMLTGRWFRLWPAVRVILASGQSLITAQNPVEAVVVRAVVRVAVVAILGAALTLAFVLSILQSSAPVGHPGLPVVPTIWQAPTGADDFHEGDGLPAVKRPDGLEIIDLKIGDGQTVPPGATVRIQYTGWLNNGKQFDTSRQPGRGALCAMLVSTQQTSGDCTPVIRGWDEGVPGMKVGGRRKLIIQPALAYGDQGVAPTIPANATLVFTIEVVSIVNSSPTSGS